MNVKKLYQELKEMQDNKEISFLTMFKILEDLKKEIQKKEAKEANQASQYRYALKVLNNKDNKSRPILQTTCIRNGIQIFTDSWIAFMLKNVIKALPTIETEEEEKRYPDFSRLKPDCNDFIDIKCIDLKNDIATLKDKEIYLLKNDYLPMALNVLNVKIMINVLNFKNDDMIRFNYIHNSSSSYHCYIRPFLIKNDSGDECILLPCRIKEEEKQWQLSKESR